MPLLGKKTYLSVFVFLLFTTNFFYAYAVIQNESIETSNPIINGGANFFSKPIYADYNNELREQNPRSDGLWHVDTPKLIKKLKEGGITTYAFLIWHSRSDWDDLRLEFLPAAQKNKINVWVYLTPPIENNPPPMGEKYEPYGNDYMAWFTEIAKLSKNFPVLKAIVMDDFTGDQAFFTPKYLKEITDGVHFINPNLKFFPINYDVSMSPGNSKLLISTAFVSKYKNLIDGIVLPYLDWNNKASLDNEKDQILMNHDILNGIKSQFIVSFPWNRSSNADDYSSISKTILKDYYSINDLRNFKFRVTDDYTGLTNGYHKLQILVNDQIIWEKDAAENPANAEYVNLNLLAYIKNKKRFTITARVYEKKPVGNFGINVNWDLPPGNWQIEEKGMFEGSGEYYKANKNTKIPLVIMIYAGGIGGWYPSDEYLYEANITAHKAMLKRKNIVGIIQYALDKTENSTQFLIIQKLYKKWQ